MKKYIKRFLFAVVTALAFWFVDTYLVNAAEYNVATYYPTSKIGGLKFNDVNALFWTYSGSSETKAMDIAIEFSSNEYFEPPFDVGDTMNFELNICSSAPVLTNVFSGYYNSIDFIYNTGNSCHFTSWEGTQYNVLLTMTVDSLDYDDVETDGGMVIWRYNFDTKSLYFVNNNDYNVSTRFLSINYLTKAEHGNLLSEYKNISQNQAIIDQNEQIIDKQEKTNNKLDNIEGSITDESSPNLGALENSAGWLPAGAVDSVLNLPLSLLNNISTNLQKSCTPITLPLPFVDKDLTLPCVSELFNMVEGLTAWWTTIGVIASAFILFSYFMKLYMWIDRTIQMQDNNQMDNWGGV